MPAEDNECDICRANLYISWIRTDEENIYCLQHSLKYINSERVQAKQCRLIITYSIEDVESLIGKIKDRISGQHQPASSQSSSGQTQSKNAKKTGRASSAGSSSKSTKQPNKGRV